MKACVRACRAWERALTEIALFTSAYLTVFSLGFQQKNVVGGHFKAAALTSFVIGASQIYLWRTLPNADLSQIIATLLGGPAGIVSAMWLHPRIIKKPQ